MTCFHYVTLADAQIRAGEERASTQHTEPHRGDAQPYHGDAASSTGKSCQRGCAGASSCELTVIVSIEFVAWSSML